MMAYIYILALFFFTISANETSWTGGGDNDTVSNTANWSNGIPTETSIVYFNDTTCPGTCTMLVDVDLTVSGLIMNGSYANGGNIQILAGAKLVVNDVFTFGNPYVRADVLIEIIEASVFEIGENCVATIHPAYYQTAIYGNDATDNWFINKGAVTFIGNGATTGYDTFTIGSTSTTEVLSVDTWGSWDVSDQKVFLLFTDLAILNIYGGSFLGSWISDTTVSIRITDTDVYLQDGDDSVSIEYVFFYSYYSVPSTNYVASLIFNTTSATVASSQFQSTKIEFWYPGTLSSVNITSDAQVNTTDAGTALFTGDNYFQNVIFTGVGIVQVDYDSSVNLNTYFTLDESVTLVNNGSWVFENAGYYFYISKDAYFVNIGVVYVNEYIYIYGVNSATKVGDIVNMGTIVLRSSISYTAAVTEGTIRQCDHGILKFDFSESDPSASDVIEIILDGFVGAVFRDTFSFYISGNELLSWKIPADSIPTGSVKYISKGPGLTGSATQAVCFSSDDLTAKVYDWEDLKVPGVCDGTDLQFLLPGASACGGLPQNIKDLEDLASCNAGANCGLDTGVPASETPAAAANVNVASLAFIISLVCLLLKF